MDGFEAAFTLVVAIEGGLERGPRDPGGATKFGISERAHPELDIANLTLAEAKAIYRRDYWEKQRCGEMPWRWALAVFDGAVNQGDCTRLMQLALRTVEDGVVGPETLALLPRAPADDFHAFLALRAERYAGAAGFPVFGHGWLKRLFRIAEAAEHPPA